MPDPSNIRSSRRLFTIGHSTRSIEEFLSLLAEAGVATLADVRRYPGSRRHPQFSSATLAESLRQAGIAYRHLEALGGRRKSHHDSPNTAWRNESFRAYADYMSTPEFHAAVDLLLSLNDPIVIMCAEAVPWRCHRNLISDDVTRRGIEVLHLLGSGSLRRHEMNPLAVDREGHLEYPASATPRLF